MAEMIPTAICERWTLRLPEHRAARPEWPWWEKPRLESMKANLRPGDVIVDVGAEEGDLSALYASWVDNRISVGGFQQIHEYPRGGVILVEPNPRVWPNIKAIWEANDLPDPLGWWVGFCAGETRLSDSDSNWNGSDDTWPDCADGPLIGDHGFLNLSERPYQIDRITLDDLTAALQVKPDAVTMDVEGSELHVIRGMERILTEDRPLVWISIHPDFMQNLYQHSRAQLLLWLEGFGYRYYHLAAEHEHHVLFWHPEGRAPVLPYDTAFGGDF